MELVFQRSGVGKNKLYPVMYSVNGGAIQEVAKYLVELGNDGTDITSLNVSCLLSLLKPIKSNMIVSGEVLEKKFYQESEWRYVPPTTNVISENNYTEERDNENNAIEQYGLEFSPSDI